MSSSNITMATTTTSSASAPSTTSSSFPLTISPLNALSSAFASPNLSIHSNTPRSDSKDKPKSLPQPNKKQSTPITPLGIIKPIISITPVGASSSHTSSNKSQPSSSRSSSESNCTISSSSQSKNFQSKGNRKSVRDSKFINQETSSNPFLPFVSPLSFLGSRNPTNEQALRVLQQEMAHHTLAKFLPNPEFLRNHFAPKTKYDEKLNTVNEKKSRLPPSHDFNHSSDFLSAHSDLLCSNYLPVSKTKNIPQSALSLVTNGKHEQSNSKSSLSGKRWSPKNGNGEEIRRMTNSHTDNRHHSRSNEKSIVAKGLDRNSQPGLGVSLSESITLTPVSPSSPSNSPLNLSMKPTPPSDGGSSQPILSPPQILPYKGAKRGPKPKPVAPDDWQKINQQQEAMKYQIETQQMQHHFKLNKTNNNKAHQGNSSSPLLPPQIHIHTKISPDNSVVITTSNDSRRLQRQSSPSFKNSSRSGLSLLSSNSRFQDFSSTSVQERVSSPRINNHSPSRSASNGVNSSNIYHPEVDRSKDDRLYGGERLEIITTEDETSGSSEDSETGSDSESSNESDRSTSGSDKSQGTTSSKSRKRGSGGESPPRKRRKYIVSDERELRIPLEHGWRRLTKIRAYSYSGVRGEVIYYGPCGKKLKTYPEVVRYLEKNGIDDITRDNFTFSSKHNVGEFLEPIGNGEYVTIGEMDVINRIEEFRAHKSRRYVPVSDRDRESSSREMRRSRKERDRLLEQMKVQQQLEEDARSVELTVNKKAETSRRIRKKEAPSKQAKETQAAEMRRQREHAKFLRMQEKMGRQEQLKMEREARAQHLLEEKKRRQDILEKQRNEEVRRKNKEKESKRLQAVVLREQERERRKQHMMLVKALETRKKQEERDRLKEEKLMEKQLERQRKMEQRQLELFLIREMKKPVEDMELTDIEPLPAVDRIPGVKLAGKAFADILMVFEFLHNFGEALGFDMDGLPSLNTLQMAVLNDESCEEELLSLMHHLLICAIEDPGIPVGAKASTSIGQSLKEMDITSTTMSEVLRIYIQANEGEKSSYLEWITRKPFLALNPTQKAAILAYLCNELLCSKTIIRQIDNNIENMNTMRRDRWVVEGKVRNLKLIQTRKLTKQMFKEANKVNVKCDSKDASEGNEKKPPVSDKKGEDEARIDSGNESEGSHEILCDVDNESIEDGFQGESVEELGKQIDKLVKQQNQFRKKLQKTSQQIRAVSLGQDRYRRRYWILPHAGGVFVEGLESSELLEDLPSSLICAKDNKLLVNNQESLSENKTEVKMEISSESLENDIKKPVDKNEQVKEEFKTEKEDESNKPRENSDNLMKLESVKSEVTETKVDVKVEEDIRPCENVKIEKEEVTDLKKLGDNELQNLPAVPQCDINAEKILKSLEEKTLTPWFSILPRMPCDETSLTRIHSSKTPPSTPLMNSHFKHSSETWISPSSLSLQQLQKLGVADINLPQFTSPHSFIHMNLQNTNLSFGNTDLSSSSTMHLLSLYNSNLAALHNSSGACSESDLSFTKFPQPSTEVQPIPKEFQNGWWRISDPNQLRVVHQKLHPRGIREKLLQLKLEKYLDVGCEACTKSSQIADLEITDLDREISQKPGGTQEADKENDWSWSMALRVDLAILEQVENLEEKVVNASMQNKHWRLAPKATDDEDIVFYPACGDPEQCQNHYPEGESQLEGKVLQCPLTTARQRLLELEENIERRYIKPPLGYGNNDVSIIQPKPNVSQNNVSEAEEKEVDEQPPSPLVHDLPEGMLRWRAAVQNSRTSSQLAVCLNYLESCIAWDRSIMKACCQFCHCDDNEAMLLLCDGCDKGYHTYCFKPKMETIPDGDWFCFECLNKATGDRVCIVCGKKGKNMCNCDNCPKAYHTDCIEPQLTRTPKSRWLCPHCKHRTTKTKSKNKKATVASKDASDSEETPKRNEKPSKVEQKSKEKPKNSIAKDLAPCRSLLADLETHEDAWPFLLPVNTKLFPSYRKVIRKPVDISTIRTKLENGSYKTKNDFMADVQLIFKNCETFNEDDSPVGKAGHSLRTFIESRWSDLNGEK